VKDNSKINQWRCDTKSLLQ